MVRSMPGVLSRNTRVLVSIALLATGSLVIGGAAFAFTDREQNAISAANANLDALHDIFGDIADAVDGQEGALDDYILTGAPSSLARYEDDAREDAAAVERLRAADYGQPEIVSALATLSAVNEDWETLVAGPAIAARKSSNQAGLDQFKTRPRPITRRSSRPSVTPPVSSTMRPPPSRCGLHRSEPPA